MLTVTQFLQDPTGFLQSIGDPIGILKAGGIPALALYCIWQIYKIIFQSNRLTLKQKTYSGIVGMLCAAFIAGFYFVPFVGWVDIAANADWGGQDVDCSSGAVPSGALCNAQILGRVSVCWTDGKNSSYPPGDFAVKCRGQKDWCTYKSVNVASAPSGQNLGTVYACARRL